LEKGGWEGFEKLSLFKLAFQILLANTVLARIRYFTKGGRKLSLNFIGNCLPAGRQGYLDL
jgi:hypothetical protein